MWRINQLHSKTRKIETIKHINNGTWDLEKSNGGRGEYGTKKKDNN